MSVQQSLYRFLKRKAFAVLNLEVNLSSGIRIAVKNKMEWIIYNDIFVECDYDRPILEALNSHDHTINILDLGANVGFFDLRVAHLASINSSSKKLYIKAVEASAALCKELAERWNLPKTRSDIKFEIVEGLVGSRDGSGQFFHFHDHGLNSIFRKNGKSQRVKNINLSQACECFEQIHLLKCDIEGSELNFLENYPDILQKTKTLVIEFHPEFCDIRTCKEILKRNGFNHSQVFKDYGNCSIHYFAKTETQVPA
jgi:FkbM family methyltransferase